MQRISLGKLLPYTCLALIACACTPHPDPPTSLDESFRVAQECIESIGASTGATDAKVMVVAGHGYGTPGDDSLGLHPPLSNALRRAADEASVLALTGDISQSGTIRSFEAIRAELDDWEAVLISPGNHDVGSPESRKAFQQLFGPTWGSQKMEDVLILWLDTDLDDWRISGDQLLWLEQALQSPDAASASSIIVLTHHLIWSRGDRSDFPVNSGPRDSSAPRDVHQLQDLLAPLGKPSLVISGDTGAFPDQVSLACDQRGNVSYVASGVGGRLQDAVLAVDLTSSPSIRVCRLDAGDLVDCVSGEGAR